MNKSYTTSMFEKIKEALNDKTTSTGFKDILKFVPENTYQIRLMPNVHDPKNTIFNYSTFGWTSRETGQYISIVSPMTFNERCPVNELRYKLYQGSEHEKSIAKLVKRNTQWLTNCYVVSNPTSPETEGQVKIIRYGKQLHKIILDAISGDDAEEYGPSIFDLSEKGNNLRVKVEKNEGGYASYISSKFVKQSSISSISNIDEVYEQSHDLSKIITIKSYDEIKEILNIHLLGENKSIEHQTSSAEQSIERNQTNTSTSSSAEEEITDQDIEDLLKDL